MSPCPGAVQVQSVPPSAGRSSEAFSARNVRQVRSAVQTQSRAASFQSRFHFSSSVAGRIRARRIMWISFSAVSSVCSLKSELAGSTNQKATA